MKIIGNAMKATLIRQTTLDIKTHLPVNDIIQAKICPDCGRILIKYRVDNSLDFYVEHCGNCNGIWFDKNEWDNIKLNNLHDRYTTFLQNLGKKEFGRKQPGKTFKTNI